MTEIENKYRYDRSWTFPYLQTLLNLGDNFLKSEQDILDVPTASSADELEVVGLVYPDEKVLIVVDVDTCSTSGPSNTEHLF